MDRKAAKKFLYFHLLCLAAGLLFPLYVWVTDRISIGRLGCLLHDIFFIYCPLCGGTRAVSAFLRLDWIEAVRCNAFVVLALIVALGFYLRAGRRLIKGRAQLWRVPGWIWVAGAVTMIAFGILRNVLLIGYGIDPLGDLIRIWN